MKVRSMNEGKEERSLHWAGNPKTATEAVIARRLKPKQTLHNQTRRRNLSTWRLFIDLLSKSVTCKLNTLCAIPPCICINRMLKFFANTSLVSKCLQLQSKPRLYYAILSSFHIEKVQELWNNVNESAVTNGKLSLYT